jgi:molecular chaperone IbpA
MTLGRITFGPLSQSMLGFDRFFDEVERMTADVKQVSTSFPHHNIIKIGDDRYVVELAVAGFSKNEIDITVEDGTLTIKGEKQDQAAEDVTYIHRGIATRSFTKQLKIADTVEVHGAEFKDGILRVGLVNVIPDHKKPKKIEIGKELKLFSPKLLQEEKSAA